MTILEFLKQSDEEGIANEIMKSGNLGVAFDIGHYCNYFQTDEKCPYECCYLKKSYDYECESFNGMCKLDFQKDAKCPYFIDRDEVVKEQVIKWLKSDL